MRTGYKREPVQEERKPKDVNSRHCTICGQKEDNYWIYYKKKQEDAYTPTTGILYNCKNEKCYMHNNLETEFFDKTTNEYKKLVFI